MNISFYLPTGTKNPGSFLNNELRTASNIKDKSTQKIVQSGLRKIAHCLSIYPPILIEGIVLFYDGASDVLEVRPYKGIEKKYYCGKDFWYPKIITEEPYILIAIDANEVSIGSIKYGISILYSKESIVPNKMKAGGQSAARFQRGREIARVLWFKQIADKLAEIARQDKRKKYEIILGGPGPSKIDFKKYIPKDILKRIIITKDIGYTSEQGLSELFNKSREDLQKSKKAKIDIVVEKFSEMLAKDNPLVSYAIPPELWDNVDTIIVSKDNEEYRKKSEELGFKYYVSKNSIVKALKICCIHRWV